MTLCNEKQSVVESEDCLISSPSFDVLNNKSNIILGVQLKLIYWFYNILYKIIHRQYIGILLKLYFCAKDLLYNILYKIINRQYIGI